MEGAAKQVLETLSSMECIKSQDNLKKLVLEISNYIRFFPGHVSRGHNLANASEKIDELLYGRIIERLLEIIDQNPTPTQDDTLYTLIQQIMMVNGSTFSMLHELLISTTVSLKKSTNDKTVNFIALTLENIVKSDALYSAIVDACKSDKRSIIEQEEFEQRWREFLQLFVSLPSRLANKMKGRIGNSFSLDSYARIMSYHLLRAISFLNDASHECNFIPKTNLIASMISKLVFALGSHRFVDFIDILVEWSLKDKKDMQRFIRNILEQLESASIKSVAVLFLKAMKNPEKIEKVFGNLVNTPQWTHVLLTKIPLLSYYNDETLIVNLIAYLACPQHGDRILTDLLIKLLDIWGDRSALNHTSSDQHEYVSKLILLSIKKLRGRLKPSDRDTVQRLLFSGTSAHLESMQVEIRAIGMITGELIVEFLSESDDAPKLIYDYESIPEAGKQLVNRMKHFFKDTNDNNSEKYLIEDSESFSSVEDKKLYELGIKCCILSTIGVKSDDENSKESHKVLNYSKNEKVSQRTSTINCETHDSDDLDSDDDLVPYDMSNDTKITDKSRPIYLRDLKDNLVNVTENKNPDIFEESLKVSEELILSQLPSDDRSFAIELLEILMTLKEVVFVKDFELLKFTSCVAIVTVYPKECTKLLCREFHAKIGEHSVNDRLFFLNVLAEAARKLSKIELIEETKQKNYSSLQIQKSKPTKPISLFLDVSGGKKYETLYDEDFEVSTSDNESNWQEIVERRIQLNTRHFAHETKRPKTTINKFNDVASCFFYPLLYGLSQKGTCLHKIPDSFIDQEHILLVHFLKTLSTIMVAAENCVVAQKIGLDILELAWTLRYHEQAKVRLSIIENIASVVVALSTENFSFEIVELLLEFRTWLFDVSQNSVRGDPDKDCRNFGRNVVALIDSVIKSTINCD